MQQKKKKKNIIKTYILLALSHDFADFNIPYFSFLDFTIFHKRLDVLGQFIFKQVQLVNQEMM